MHPRALKSRLLAAYVNVKPRPVAPDDWDVRRDSSKIRSEDVARWLIVHAPEVWAAWCQKYTMRFDPELDEFIDLNEWGSRLAFQVDNSKGWDLTKRLEAMIDPNPNNWKKPPP